MTMTRSRKRREVMQSLPDEIWMKIFELGVNNSILTHKDLYSLSISCKHFDKLSSDDTLWSTLLTLNFPPPSQQPLSCSSVSKKSLYKHQEKLRTDTKLQIIPELRKHLAATSRRIKRVRRRITLERELIPGETAEQGQEYQEMFEELDEMEKRQTSFKKTVSKAHASLKKKYRKFHASKDIEVDNGFN